MTPIVFFDEAGNTGPNLLDPAQPVFVLASVYISQQHAKELYSLVARDSHHVLHFTNLKRNQNGRERILRFLDSPLLTKDSVQVTLIHKPYMVTAEIVDLLIEPLAHRDGLDLYRHGAAVALANLLHHVTPVFCGEDRFKRFQHAFVQMIRSKTSADIVHFYNSVEDMIRNCTHDRFKTVLSGILATSNDIADLLRHITPIFINPAFTSFATDCSTWGGNLNSWFHVIHDRSKPLAGERRLLRLLMARDEPIVRVGFDDRAMELPLRVSRLTFAQSRNHVRLQIADLLASACAYWANMLCGVSGEVEFRREIGERVLERFVSEPVWPQAAVTPEELGTVEGKGVSAIGYMTEMVARQRRKQRSAARERSTK